MVYLETLLRIFSVNILPGYFMVDDLIDGPTKDNAYAVYSLLIDIDCSTLIQNTNNLIMGGFALFKSEHKTVICFT
jgi:hypothetical protein